MPIAAPFSITHPVRRVRGSGLSGIRIITSALALAAFSLSISTSWGQMPATPAGTVQAPSPFTYADVADLASLAEMIAVARPRSFAKVPPAAGVNPSDTQRFYVIADMDSLIRGDAGVPPRIAFLIDLPLDVKPGRTLKGKPFILFGRAGGRPGEFQLLSSTAMLPASPATDALVRTIARELVAPGAAPEIARIVEAFHVEGTIAGESETQAFLATRTGRPISLSIVRRPDMEPRFGAALGEIVDEAADLPAPGTLLWYRLACSLPAALPDSAVAKLDPVSAQAAAADYRSFVARLAPCTRTRGPSARQ